MHHDDSNPLISVGIPAYKAKNLGTAICSVLNQSYQNIELIVVNDHSPEDIEAVMNLFHDERIRYYVNEKNMGRDDPARNWNVCLSYAKGTFFSLLCDDDYYEPEFLKEMLLLAQRYTDTNVFRARADIVDADGARIDKYASSPEWESWDDYLWHVCQRYRAQTISEWMFRVDVLKRLGGFARLPLAWYADYLSVFRVAKEGGIASTSRLLVHFRQSGVNLSSNYERNILPKLEATRLYECAVTEMLEENPDKDSLLETMKKLLKVHRRYYLYQTPKKQLLAVFLRSKQLNVKKSLIWHALWH